MSTIREELINAAINRAYTLIDYNIHKGFHEQYEFMQQTILADNSLTEEEKTEAIRLNIEDYDRDKIKYNSGIRRICENCNQKCLATLYCEYCVQNYLKDNFSNWISGNNNIDNLIKNLQMKTIMPSKIVEWIPYNNLQNIEYLTRGGFSKIYTADWIGGRYDEWDSKERKLIRFGTIKVILKQLENVESASQSWFEEAKSHLTISNKYAEIVQCFGLTQNLSNGNYMLVMRKKDVNLREYLQNHNQLTWKERIKIAFLTINALYNIHEENSIHRDLHSGNILYSQFNDNWYISDFGFCGPANKSSTCIYGNLPYIAPEVFNGKECTFKSDIYSIAMLMWEISSGQPPFMNYEHDCNLAINIINGIRPKIIPEIPSGYKSLMEQCWDADPLKRPDIDTLRNKMNDIMSYYQNKPNELPQLKLKINKEIINRGSKLFTSKIHKFEKLPEPKNATEEEQEAFHSKSYDFSIPYNISDFGKSSDQNNNNNTSKISSIIKDSNSKKLSKVFKKLQISSKNDNQNDYNKKTVITQNVNNEDDEEVYNNPNLHSEEQDKFEIPDGSSIL
ncbi:kinase-like domain-containing protein [Rhizophagus irregularis DAOM 181602=DAOM 197198]|nr:kinase-like domain-containing protein [Rhizophagus irregularis DAOM 181602=DAOM 197198]